MVEARKMVQLVKRIQTVQEVEGNMDVDVVADREEGK